MEGSLEELAGYRLARAQEILDKNLAIIIKSSSFCREKSDYDDFYVAGREEAEEQLKNAKYFVQKIENYVNAINK